MMIIYKITNIINNKVYIGLTTTSLKKRWRAHKNSINENNSKHLYRSMRKYGIENFKIEQIDETEDFKILGEKERYYIKLYDSRNPEKGYNLTAGGERNQWDANPSAKLTYEEVVHIREIYDMKEMRLSECWKLYSDKISYDAFQKVWEGATWKGVLDEVYTEENKQYYSHRKELPGEKNGNALYTNKEVLEIRKYYVNHTFQKTFEKYGSRNTSKRGFRGIIDKTYSNIPKYSKINKVWLLDGKEINIDSFEL